MPFKSDKQRKWMHANEPEMAKKWEKEESINEANASVIRKKLLKQFGDDPLYKDFIIAKTPKDQKKALKTLKSIRGFNAVRLMQKYVKKLQGESIKGKLRNVIRQEIKSINEIKTKDSKGKPIKPGELYYFTFIGAGRHKKPKVVKVIRNDAKGIVYHDFGDNSKYTIPMSLIKRKKMGGYFTLHESINEGFDKYHLGGLLDSKLKKRLERAIKIWGGKIDAVGDDYIKFRLSSFEVAKFPALLKKLDKNKNVWIGDKRKNNIWDRRRNIDKLGESKILRAKQMVLLPDKKMYFDPMSNHLWLMGPYGGPDLDDDPIEPRDRDYNKIIRKLSGKDKSVLKKAMRTRKRRKEATTSVSVPGYLSPQAFSKSTQRAIDTDDEDDEKSESINERKLSSHQKKAILIAIEMSGNMTGATKKIERIKKGLSNDKKVKDALRLANESINEGKWSKIMRSVRKGSKAGPWSIVVYDKRERKVKHQRLVKILQQIPAHYEDVKKKYPRDKIGIEDKYGERVYTESINESDLGLTYKKGKTITVTHKKSGKELVIIDKPNVRREYEKIGFYAEGKVNELSMAPFSSSEARLHVNSDIKDMSKYLGKASHKVIKTMMDGVKHRKYTPMDISRGLQEGPAGRTHFGELTFIKSLWHKMRDKFRKYSKDGKLS